MSQDFDRQLYIDAIKGRTPTHDLFDHPLVKRSGSYTGGFKDEWHWNYYFDLTDTELIRLYNLLRY